MINATCCRSRWPRGLRWGSAADRLLELWVRILPGAWLLLYVLYIKDKRQRPGQSGQGSRYKVQREREKIPPEAWISVSLEFCVCCQVEVSATRRSPVQRSPTGCCVTVCDLETGSTVRPWVALCCCAREKIYHSVFLKTSLWGTVRDRMILTHHNPVLLVQG